MESSRSSLLVKFSLAAFCLVTLFTPFASAICAYPSDLLGLWYSSQQNSGQVTWTNTTASTFSYKINNIDYNLVFECYFVEGNYYVSRSTSPVILYTANFYVYTCWEFTKVSDNKYIYRQAVAEDWSIDNERIKVIPESTSVTQASTICDDTTYGNHRYSVLVRNGTIDVEKIICPDPLLATGRYTISDSSTSYCNDESWLDGCSGNATLTANTTLCTTPIFHSTSGMVYCLYSTPFSATQTNSLDEPQTYYLTLFNSDESPDQTATYYFTCVAVTTISGVVYMTQYPSECLNSTYMNATLMDNADGRTIVYQTNTTCVSSSDSSDDNLALILGISLGILGLIVIMFVLIIVAFCIIDIQTKKATSARSNSKVVPDTLPNTAMSHGDKNYRMMFTPAPPRSAAPGGRHQDYYDGGRAGSEVSLRPTVSQLANYRTPTPMISSSKGEEQGDSNGLATIPDHLGPEGKGKETATIMDEEGGSQRKGAVAEERIKEHEKKKVKADKVKDAEGEKEEKANTTTPTSPSDLASETTTSTELSGTTSTVNGKREQPAERAQSTRPTTQTPAQDTETTPEEKGSSENSGRRIKTASTTRHPPKLPKAKQGASQTSPKKSTPTTPKRAWSSGSSSRQSRQGSASIKSTAKVENIDSILDFDSKRIGEPDGAESGVMLDIEGSLPVFSESGDLTPEPTRITPHGHINPPRRPKPTPKDIGL